MQGNASPGPLSLLVKMVYRLLSIVEAQKPKGEEKESKSNIIRCQQLQHVMLLRVNTCQDSHSTYRID